MRREIAMNGLSRLLFAAMAFAMLGAAAFSDTIKVGVIGPMSGPFALYGQNFKTGIDTWVAEHGSKVAGHDVEFIYRDEGSPNPAHSKALAQELLVKDKVDYLAGAYFTPDAMAMAPRSRRPSPGRSRRARRNQNRGSEMRPFAVHSANSSDAMR